MLSRILWKIGMALAGAAIVIKIIGAIFLIIIGIIILAIVF